MPAIVYSSLDPAGKNIASLLKSAHGFAPAEKIGGLHAWRNGSGIMLAEIGTPTITADYLDEAIRTDLIVFASRHKSESGKPTLTAHACGNWGVAAEFGGRPRTLAPTSAHAIKAAMESLARSGASDHALAGFDVVMECTHHGPLLKTPFLFVEIGSTEREWRLPGPGAAAAEACLAACAPAREGARVAIGVGGIHYPREFTKEVLRKGPGLAVGHVCPKYAVEFLDEGMMAQMLAKSGGAVMLALVGWKSLKPGGREKALSLLNAFNVPYQKV